MAAALEKVRGIGPVTARYLAEQGITSLEVLAASRPGRLIALQGFNEIRAEQILAAARELLSAAPDAPDTAPSGPAGKAKKKKKDKQDKDKKKGKKKSARKTPGKKPKSGKQDKSGDKGKKGKKSSGKKKSK